MKKYNNISNNENYYPPNNTNNTINHIYNDNILSDTYLHNKLNLLNMNKLNKKNYINQESTSDSYKENKISNDINNITL
jgi:hypothetical protein